MCVEVESDILLGNITITYETIEGSAKGTKTLLKCNFCQSLIHFSLIVKIRLGFIILAPGDFIDATGALLINFNSLQCVNITIINDSEDEQDLECFAFAISTVSPSEDHELHTSQTTVCIVDDDGMYSSQTSHIV